MQYRTQKANGLRFLGSLPGTSTVPHRIVQSAGEIQGAFESLAHYRGGLFARPCPERPRHGFVESRKVSTIEEAVMVFLEAQAQDPMAEMILMPKIEAQASAIYTPTTLAIGPGHDGATSGTGSMGFNLAMGSIHPEILIGAGVKTHPYIEIVYGSVDGEGVTPYAVQIRDGEVPDGAGDQVANDLTVCEIYELPESNSEKMSELDWEKFVPSLAKSPGTVVYHPGGTSTSHYAVHCKLHGVPCVFSHRPKIGEELLKTVVGEDLTDPFAMRVGLEIGAIAPLTYRQAMKVALFGLHQYATNSNPLGSKLQGIAAACLVRLAMTACLGELRHKRKWRGNEIIDHGTRRIVFERAWSDFFLAHKMMGPAVKDFMTTKWRSGYGGKAWGVGAMRAIELSDACIALYRKPTLDNAKGVIAKLNIAVNTAHNNGWLFNKFAPSEWMDLAAESDPAMVIASGHAIFKAMTSPRPDSSGWMTARKNRGLTELRNRLDLEDIASRYGRR